MWLKQIVRCATEDSGEFSLSSDLKDGDAFFDDEAVYVNIQGEA